VCALSFTLTLMRESFNAWSVDFLVSIQGDTKSLATAALHSTGFDVAGAVSIFATGFVYDRISPGRRRWLMASMLILLAAVLAMLPRAAAIDPMWGALSGVLAVESGGGRLAATSAGIIDGVGYVAGALAGTTLGRLLDVGGYALGFRILALITVISAALALALRPARTQNG
jgi:sugar phosphate permease